MIESFPYLGEVLSLLTAVVWGIAVILFKKSGEVVHPIALNLFKNVFAAVLFIPTIWIFNEPLTQHAPLKTYLLPILSGVIGIGIGDTLLFASLNKIGASLTGIVGCLYSPFVILLSMIALGERLTVLQLIGVIMIISAVLTVTRERKETRIAHRDLLFGIFLGVLSVACVAMGVVIVKPVLRYSPLLWVIEIRLLGGIFVMFLIFLFNPSRQRVISTLFSTHNLIYTVSGSFTGAYLATFLWLAGMKLTQASVASALNQTSNIFIFIFGAIFLHEPINLRRLLAIIIGFSGIYLIFFG